MDLFKFIQFSSHLICFGLAVDLLYVFLRAFLNGGSVVLDVNSYGEAKFELVLIPIVIVFCGIGLYFNWVSLK